MALRNPLVNVEAPDNSGQSEPPLRKLRITATFYRCARAGQFDNRPEHDTEWKQPPTSRGVKKGIFAAHGCANSEPSRKARRVSETTDSDR